MIVDEDAAKDLISPVAIVFDEVHRYNQYIIDVIRVFDKNPNHECRITYLTVTPWNGRTMVPGRSS